MSADYGQLSSSLDSLQLLFPFPSGELTADDFSQRKVCKRDDRSIAFQVEFHLLSAIEFRVQSSRGQSQYHDIFVPIMKFTKPKNTINTYDLNLKYYTHVLSKIKYLHEECYLTINWSLLDKDLIDILVQNLSQNDNILTFIQNPKSRLSIIESLESNKEHKKSMKILLKYKMFDDLDDNQIIAFYMSVIRDGKSILADISGKSLSALLIMTYFSDDWPLVIVCEEKRKTYWSEMLTERYKCAELFKISVINCKKDLYVYPEPFHNIIIIDYELYYELKNTISFSCLNIKAFIFEDQCRGVSESGEAKPNKQWKGLSQCFDNMSKVKRILFITTGIDLNYCKRLYPLLRILDPKAFNDYNRFETRYCTENHPQRDQRIQELQILLRSTFLIKN